jgi:hypothetical protein
MKKWKRNVAWMVFAFVLSAGSPPAGAEPHPGIPGGFVPPVHGELLIRPILSKCIRAFSL